MDDYNLVTRSDTFKLLPVQYFFIALTLVIAFLYNQDNSALMLVIYLFAFAFCLLFMPGRLLELYIVVYPFTGDILSSYVSISLFAIALFFLMGKNAFKYSIKSIFFVALTIVAVAISSTFGYKPDFNIALLGLLYFITVVYISRLSAETALFRNLAIALIIRAVGLAVFLGLKALSGKSVLLFGRLSFSNEASGIDKVAYTAVIGVFFSAIILFDGEKIKKGLFIWIGFAISLITLALSLNRGAILSFIISFLSYFILGKKKRVQNFIIMVLITGIACLFLYSIEGLRLQRISDFDLNGRLEGWFYYFYLLIKGGYVFGFGPGYIQRMGSGIYSSFYSHSFYFDLIYSYGIIGIVYIYIMILFAIKAMKNTGSNVKKCVLIGILCTGLTHGVVADFNLLISYAVLVGWINSEKKHKFLPEPKLLQKDILISQ